MTKNYLVQIGVMKHQDLDAGSNQPTDVFCLPCCPTQTALTSWCSAHWQLLWCTQSTAPICN